MYFDTDTLLKYTDPKFFVTHLLWICYLLYHCKTKVFIKLFIENKGLHWSLKTERTIKCLRAGKEPAKGPYYHLLCRVYLSFLKWRINALQTTVLLELVLWLRQLLPFQNSVSSWGAECVFCNATLTKERGKLSPPNHSLEAELPQFLAWVLVEKQKSSYSSTLGKPLTNGLAPSNPSKPLLHPDSSH